MGIFKKPQLKKEEKKPETVQGRNAARVERKMLDPRETMKIKHPWTTEKAGILIDSGKYVFRVVRKANKPQIEKAIESIYGVKVLSVNIINKKGKVKRLGRSVGRIPGYKKAIVQLRKGDKIDVMPT
jgi:large subunit ribosomal protein L23